MELFGVERSARLRMDGNGRVTALNGKFAHDGYLTILQTDDGELFASLRTLEFPAFLHEQREVLVEGNSESDPSLRIRAAGDIVATNGRRFVDHSGYTDAWIHLQYARLAHSLAPDEDVFADSVKVLRGRVHLYNQFLPVTNVMLRGLSLTLAPSTTLRDQKASYKQAGGIFPTHIAEFATVGLTVPELHSALNDICTVFTLAGLTYVFWPEAVAVERGHTVMQYLRPPITRRKVRDPWATMAGVDVQEIADRFSAFDPIEKSLAQRYVHQLVDATDETVFLETRALSAVVLLERILNDKVERKIPGHTPSSLKGLRSKLVAAANNLYPDLSANVVDNIREGLAGMGEISFRAALAEFVTARELAPLNDRAAIVKSVGQIRNLLVHEGRFVDSPTWPHHEQYALVHWLAAASTARAVGVQSGFQEVPAHIKRSMHTRAGD